MNKNVFLLLLKKLNDTWIKLVLQAIAHVTIYFLKSTLARVVKKKWQLQRNWVESNDHVFSAEISEFQKVDV